MGYFNEKLRTVIDNDRYVSEHNRKGELRAQDGIILISAAAYMIMSVLNAIQSSEMIGFLKFQKDSLVLVITTQKFGL